MLRFARQAFGRLIDRGTDYLFAGLYWLATRVLRPAKVGGLQVLDVRGASEEDEAYLLRCFGEALEMISSARAGFASSLQGICDSWSLAELLGTSPHPRLGPTLRHWVAIAGPTVSTLRAA
jgi:hypothetical protein